MKTRKSKQTNKNKDFQNREIRRTRSVCLSWPLNYSRRSRHTRNRSRKRRKSKHSTSQSSGKLNRSWKKLRNEPSLLKLKSTFRLPNSMTRSRKAPSVEDKNTQTYPSSTPAENQFNQL